MINGNGNCFTLVRVIASTIRQSEAGVPQGRDPLYEYGLSNNLEIYVYADGTCTGLEFKSKEALIKIDETIEIL
jgi:hypothetical protein